MSAGGDKKAGLDPTTTTELIDALHAVARRINEHTAEDFATLQGIMLRGARVVPVGPLGNQRLSTVPGTLLGWALHNVDTANPGQVNLYDGPDGSGDLIAPITMNPDESTRDWFGPGGLAFTKGLYVAFVANAVEGSIFIQGGAN